MSALDEAMEGYGRASRREGIGLAITRIAEMKREAIRDATIRATEHQLGRTEALHDAEQELLKLLEESPK